MLVLENSTKKPYSKTTNKTHKFHQYITYIRPMLTHELENLVLLVKETQQIQLTETGILLRNLSKTQSKCASYAYQKIAKKNKS